MLKLALRNVFRHAGRTMLTLAAIVAGVVGLILSGGFIHDIFVQLAEAVIHSRSGHIQVSRTGYQETGSRKPEQFLIGDPERLERRILSVSGVTDTMARIRFSGLLNNGRTDVAISGEGIEPEKESRLGSYLSIVAGRPLDRTDTSGAMLGAGVARALNLTAGDHATLLLSTQAGAMNTLELDIVGVFRSFSKDYDARTIKISLAAARDSLDTHGANAIVVLLAHTADTERVARDLRVQLRGEGLEVWTWEALNDFYAKAVNLYARQFGVLRLIILVLVLLSVANSVNMGLFERVAEFGTMRAMGDRQSYVARLIITEMLLLGVIGSTIAVIVGALLSVVISAIGIPMPPPPNADLAYTARIEFVPSIALGSFLIGVAAATFAGIVPAIRIVRTPVVDALRQAI